MSVIRSRPPAPSLELTPDEVAVHELTEYWDAEDVFIGDDGFLYYHENWVIQGKQA